MRSASRTIEIRNSATFRIAVTAVVMILVTETQWSYEFSRITTAFFAVAAASLLALPGLPRRVYLISPIAAALTVLAVVSHTWSDYSTNAFQNSLFVVAALYCATLVASTCSSTEIGWGISLGLFAVLLASVFVVVTDPSAAVVGDAYENGALKGVFGHRNLFAFFMLVGLAVAVSVFGESLAAKTAKLVLAGAFTTAIVLSSSATSIAVALLVIAVAVSVALLRLVPRARRTSIAIGVGAVSIIGILAVVANLSPVFAALGRDSTLTYRTVIWDVSAKWAAERPLLGYGWESIWGQNRSPGREITGELALNINHAHSIYVEMWLALGAVGVALLVLGLLVAFAYSVAGSVFGDGRSLLWLTLTIVLAVHGLTETMLLRPAGLVLFFLVLARAVNDGGRPSPVTRILCLALSVRGGRPPELWRGAAEH